MAQAHPRASRRRLAKSRPRRPHALELSSLKLNGPGYALTLQRAADLVHNTVSETLAYYAFPEEHWRRIRTNNPLERLMREIRRRTRVVGAFPDGQSCLNLAAARLRHIAGTSWSSKRYLTMDALLKTEHKLQTA